MSEKYYQEYGPMRRRGKSSDKPAAGPLDPITEPEYTDDEEPGDPGVPPPVPPRSGRRNSIRLLMTTALVVAGILAVPYVLSFVLPLMAGNQAPQGVSIQGQAVGGMTRDAIRLLLEERYGAFERAPLTLTYEGRSWELSLQELGARIDLDRTADAALTAGATGGPLDRARAWWLLWQGGRDLAPAVEVDLPTLQRTLLSLASEIEQPPRDASISFAAGKVLPTGARVGRQVLVDDTVIDILRALQSLTPQQVALRTRTLAPRIDDTGAAQAIEDARTLLKSPLRLRQGARDWTWDQERIVSMLVVRAEGGRLIADVDHDRLARQIEKLAQVVDSGSSEPRLAFRNGRLQIVEPGQTGIRLKQTEAAEAIIAALRADPHSLELPTENVAPQVTEASLPSLGVIELVAEGRSSFVGSAPYRVTNIEAGARRMNGVLIAPGDEFSFNTQLGEVDEANGFVQGYAVIGNRTQLEWGGGVCQVSTTVFRAAFWAGVPITERHAHPFYISWYDAYSYPNDAGPGMDATIFTGVQDFKFVNDTGTYMLMEAVVDSADQVLTVRLYGTRPDRVVEVVGPEIANEIPPPAEPVYITDPALPAGTVKQTDRARKGMDIVVYRVIEEGGVRQPPEQFFTRFKAWPDVFVRGIGSP